MEKATKEQLTQIGKKHSANPSWLKKLKSQAPKICIEQKKPTTT
jgi:2,4-dienoyl-CoA reductase-like NADH-dependent reductase (Old Yellow Enzyme family)